MNKSDPIGVFDSGVGGLSVLQRIRTLLPNEHLHYIADEKHLPYGEKPRQYIEQRAIAMTQFLLAQKAKAIVVACNTATAAAIATLRERFELPIIGMEPGVKPALALTKTGVVGVLATRETLCSEKFETLLNRFCDNHKVVVQACPGLVERIEQLDLTGPQTQRLVKSYVSALLAQNADTIVLGCTHYPFLTDLISQIAGPGVSIIDTGAAVAREVQRRLREAGILSDSVTKGTEHFWTTGSPEGFQHVLDRLWHQPITVLSVPEDANMID